MTKKAEIHAEQRKSMDNGVIYKSIYELERNELEFFARRMKSFEEQGEYIKVMYHLPIKLHVFDQCTVMFSMINKVNPESNLTYLVIEHSDLAETLISTFNLYWQRAISVTDFLKKENLKI